MPWQYSQSTGVLTHNGVAVGRGYSGRGAARDNPRMQNVAGLGPIPRGRYRIGPPHHSVNTGPRVMNPTPIGHHALGRTDFQIHGDNREHNASRGCVILAPELRNRIVGSNDPFLDVVE